MDMNNVTGLLTKTIGFLGEQKDSAIGGIASLGDYLGKTVTWLRNTLPLTDKVGMGAIALISLLYVTYKTYEFFTASAGSVTTISDDKVKSIAKSQM